MRVSYPGIGESPFKTVAFSPSMTVEEACKICASKGGLKDKVGEYGLSIKDSGTWLKAGDTLDKYPLQNCVRTTQLLLFYCLLCVNNFLCFIT